VRLTILAVGRLKAGPERTLSDRYAARFAALARSLGFDGPHGAECAESQSRRPEDRMSDEAKALLSALPPDAYTVALDERGKSMTSPEFAELLKKQRESGKAQMIFLIGGADGLSETVRRRADLLLSFGAMTLPHQMIRVLLLEQLYRAATILQGHPYHRV
jgi:23S rRNA (pseudouridine1915-N3)-methyltransferase